MPYCFRGVILKFYISAGAKPLTGVTINNEENTVVVFFFFFLNTAFSYAFCFEDLDSAHIAEHSCQKKVVKLRLTRDQAILFPEIVNQVFLDAAWYVITT